MCSSNKNLARVNTAGVIILTTGLVIAVLMHMFGIPMWPVLVAAGIALLVVAGVDRVTTMLLSAAMVLSLVAYTSETIAPSVRLTMLIVAALYLGCGVLWWILERRKKCEEEYTVVKDIAYDGGGMSG